MILGNPNDTHFASADRTTLDDLFRIAGVRRPDAVALADPPNRASFTNGEPRRLTYAQADHIVSAIAGRLRRLGLSTDAVVALQFPNIVEATLALLGVLRAGMIAAPLPLLWRRAEAAAALNRLGAKAILTTSRAGRADLCQVATDVAAEVFAVRYVCSFGANLSDGVIPLDDLMEGAPLLDPPVPVERAGLASAHVAVVTFETTADGVVPVARNHLELIAGGRAVQLGAGLPDGAAILAACGGSSFAGLSCGALPWLLAGGTLALHHPFDPAVLAQQCSDEACDTAVVPGALAAQIAHATLTGREALRRVVALWRAPERLPVSPPWPFPQLRLADVLAFGETALICGARSASGEPAKIPLGPAFATQDGVDAAVTAETSVTQSGTLAIRGAMVPRQPFPPGAERSPVACFRPDERGFADTRYPCRADRDGGTLEITGPPAGLVGIGGYRFAADRMQELLGAAFGDAVLAALPDALAGHRLAGRALDRAAIREALKASGANALLNAAFADRRRPDPA